MAWICSFISEFCSKEPSSPRSILSIARQSFSKSVAFWPVAGFFAKLQRTIFVERQRRASVGAQRDMLQQRLEEGVNVILFPEGTSYDGARVLPFKSALFAAAEREVGGHPVTVQPMSLAYVAMDGLPLTRAQRPAVAWYGDMDLAPHLLDYLKGGPYECTLKFFEPVIAEEIGNRKALARYCREKIVLGNSEALSGGGRNLPKA